MDRERKVKCGFCLQEYPLSEVTQHGLDTCIVLDSSNVDTLTNWYGAQALELFDRYVSMYDELREGVEDLASEVDPEYTELLEHLDGDDEVETLVMDAEQLAEALIVKNLIKRLAFVYSIQL